jgi:hypothetical protein
VAVFFGDTMAKKSKALIQRKFWARVNILGDDDCWEWTGNIGPIGYGHAWSQDDQRNTTAHRVAWQILFGDIPDDIEIGHRCENRNCVNPAHLYLTTHKENVREAVYREKYLYPNTISEGMIASAQRQARGYNHPLIEPEIMPLEPEIMPCGHPSSYLVSSGEGTSFCLMCEYNAQAKILRELDKFLDYYNCL